MGVVAFLLLFSFTFYVELSSNNDFSRIQTIMIQLQNKSMSFGDFLRSDNMYFSSSLKYTYSFNIFLYSVSKLFKNRYALVWLSVIIDYSLVCYLAYHWKNRYSIVEVIFSGLLCLAFMPFVHVVSGLRTATATSIMGVGIYRYLCQKAQLREFALFCILSATYHPVVILTIPIVLMVRFFDNKWIVIAIFVGALFLSKIVNYLSEVGGAFFGFIERKYETYYAADQFRASRLILYSVIVLCICILLYYFFFTRKSSETQSDIETDKMYLFIACYAGLALGNIGSYEMIVRSGYMFGVFAPVVVSFFQLNKKSTSLIAFAIKGIAIASAVFSLLGLYRSFGGLFHLSNIPKALNLL